MDSCSGYLCYIIIIFETRILWLVHSAVRLFDLLKDAPWKGSIHVMKECVRAFTNSDQVEAEEVTWEDFHNWKKFFDRFFKKLLAVKKYRIFKASEVIGLGKIRIITSNNEDKREQRLIPFS